MKQCEMCGNKFCPICHAVTFKFAQSVNFPKNSTAKDCSTLKIEMKMIHYKT